MIASGLLLADRYRLTGRIAVGGMGEVWQADDTRLHRTVAVKILKAELSGDAEFLHRFRAEARTTASLNHPGIAAVHDYGEASADGSSDEDTSGHVAYLVMELVKGEPLAGILAKEGRLSAERLLPILHQAGKALNAAHEHGLVHRDVKPGNILVTREADGTETVKLTDFGIAKAGHSAPVTRGGMVMGTAHYIAPEQATGQNATPASDVYSLAVCGYECLAGHRPFIADHAVTVAMMHIRDIPPPLPPDVPPTVRALIEGTLVKDPNQRYATGGEYADAVAMVMAGHMPPAPIGATRTPPGGLAMPATAAAPHPATLQVATPSAPFAPAVPASRGTGWIWGLVAVIAVVLVVLAVVLLLVMRDGGPNGDQPGSPVVTTPQTTLPGSPPFGTPSEPPAETTTESVPTDEETAPPESTYESGETDPSPFSPERSPTQDGVEGLDGDGIDGASHNHVGNGDHNAREALIAAGQRQPPRRGVW